MSCASKEAIFDIDESISKDIDSTFEANVFFKSSIKPEFAFHVRSTFDHRRFAHDEMNLAYFLQSEDLESTDYASSITSCYLSKDTIVLIGGLFYESGLWFRITILQESFNCQLYLNSTEKTYSKTQHRDDLRKEIFVQCDTASMTLVQKPGFMIGSTLKGILTMKSEPFYQLDKDNVLVKIKPEFDIIFDTTVGEEEQVRIESHIDKEHCQDVTSLCQARNSGREQW